MIPINVQVSAKMVRPFLQDKWFWWVDLDDDRYAYGESSSYADVLGEMGEGLKRLDEESGEVKLPEIVRCRDCNHAFAHGNGCGYWPEIHDVEPDGFCKWAERKEVNE